MKKQITHEKQIEKYRIKTDHAGTTNKKKSEKQITHEKNDDIKKLRLKPLTKKANLRVPKKTKKAWKRKLKLKPR